MTHFVPFGVFLLLPGLECRGASGSGCRWNGATLFSCTQTAKNAAIRGSASDRYTHTHTHTHTHRQTDRQIHIQRFSDPRSISALLPLVRLAVSCCGAVGGTRYTSQRGEPGCHRKVTAAVSVFYLEASSGNRRAALMTVIISGQTSAVSRL